MQIYIEAAEEVHSSSRQQCIVIASAFVPSFKHKSYEDVLKHADAFKLMCSQPVSYVCFSDDIPEEDARQHGIQAVKFSSREARDDESKHQLELKRDDISWPDDAAVCWTSLD